MAMRHCSNVILVCWTQTHYLVNVPSYYDSMIKELNDHSFDSRNWSWRLLYTCWCIDVYCK